ncbi:MAG: hypothetical protein M3O15_02375 [Acidobacteriota bacterium]|nr:hypothetical protein [Acidobacteriota bacterium]
MTLEELEDALPNGLHDASLRSLAIDYVGQEARLIFDIDTSDESREVERPGHVTLLGLVYFVIEPPDARYKYDVGAALWVDAIPTGETTPPSNLPAAPEGSFAYCLFVRNWNSCLYVAARDVRFEWAGEERAK